MGKAITIILRIINTSIITLAVLIAVAFVGVRAAGIDLYMVLSGSMEPDYPTGSLLWVKDTDPEELHSGDVITFHLSSETTATHRIVERVPDEADPNAIWFRTKGDANEEEDANLVSGNDVIGVPILCVPKLGYFISYLQTPSGKTTALMFGGALLIFVFVTDSLVSNRRNKENKTDKRGISEDN